MKSYKHIPTLDIGVRYGYTDYIDFIRKNELTSPVMQGIDRYNRPFIVFSGTVSGVCGKNGEGTFSRPFMQTIFQRYSNVSTLWVGCGHGDRNLFYSPGGLDTAQLKVIHHLIREEDDDDDSYYNNGCGGDFAAANHSRRYNTTTENGEPAAAAVAVSVEDADVISALRFDVPDNTTVVNVVLHCPKLF